LEENFDRFNFLAIYKEKEMADFRRWITVLAVLALCVGFASAQTAQTCTSNASVTPTLRSEGFTELTGDIVITCTGGPTVTPGTAISSANITVFFGTQMTSRLLGTGGISNASEALLMIDEPNNPSLGTYGSNQAMVVCSTPASGCTDFSATASGTAPSGSPYSNNGGNVMAAGAANIFQGLVTGNSVTFQGVPILAPGSTGTRVYRMTNLRVNANALNSSSTAPAPVNAFISISGSTSLPLTNSQLVVGYATSGLTTALKTGSGGSLSSSGTSFNQCQSQNSSSGASPSGTQYGSFAALLQYSANFGTAFKQRTAAGPFGPGNTGGTFGPQNTPGTIYNNSESGFIVPTLTDSSNTALSAGLADFGTRFKAVFTNVPAGVTLMVSTVNVTNAPQNIAPATTSSYAVLIASETAPENSYTGLPSIASTVTGAGTIPFAPITPVSGTATAVWEVLTSNTNILQNFNFAVYTLYSANTSTNTPATGPMTVNLSYAPNPTQGAFSASAGVNASATLPIPRFADTSTAKTFANVALCQTDLLFPYITTVTGFETGLAISNTSADIFSTTQQTGACTLNWFGNPSGTPNPAQGNTGTVAAGTTWTGVSSNTSYGAGANFTGYMIAQCNFQYAHGYAAITDIGVRNILASYLALVMNNGNSISGGTGLGGLNRVSSNGEVLVH
jgi:hypothetical protein